MNSCLISISRMRVAIFALSPRYLLSWVISDEPPDGRVTWLQTPATAADPDAFLSEALTGWNVNRPLSGSGWTQSVGDLGNELAADIATAR